MAWWVTPSGTTVSLDHGTEHTRSGHAAVFIDLNVGSTGGELRPVEVRLDAPEYINGLRVKNQLPPLTEQDRAEAARVAAIRAVDASPDFFGDAEPLRLELGYEELDSPPVEPVSDKALRRYLARRLYLVWQDGSFDDYLRFEPTDVALTGVGPEAFLRNLQLLEQEGYVEVSRTFGAGFSGFEARATADLVRDVERHGDARADVESQEDFNARIEGLGSLAPERASVIAERHRYEVAQTTEEVASVFRAVMPVLEGLVRRLLRAHGSDKEHGTLGPMISELRQLSIGTRGLWSQLNAVLNNGRDISLHGEELPVAVLRMACENCFELFPQLGQLFPVDPSGSSV